VTLRRGFAGDEDTSYAGGNHDQEQAFCIYLGSAHRLAWGIILGGMPSSLIVPVFKAAVVASTDFPAGALTESDSFVACLFPQLISAAGRANVPTINMGNLIFMTRSSSVSIPGLYVL
jgi:hypothetical protein